MKQLTKNQKAARRAIRRAAQDLIREVDARSYHRDGVEFRAYFHLSCIRQDTHGIIDYPLHRFAWAKA